jgi:dephospho-CoA kinase
LRGHQSRADPNSIPMNERVRMFGLTGGIASGKTTVARYFEELGARLINADRLGHELLQPSSPSHQEIVASFGKEILDASGLIDRKRLGAVVFAERARLATLNAILHPHIMARTEELAARFLRQDPHAVIIVDAALIYEAHFEPRFAKIVVTWCRPEQQAERLAAKGLDGEDAKRRILAQMDAEEKRRRADYVIDCSGSLENTRQQVVALYPELQRLIEAL